jgi:hypothetical protein
MVAARALNALESFIEFLMFFDTLWTLVNMRAKQNTTMMHGISMFMTTMSRFWKPLTRGASKHRSAALLYSVMLRLINAGKQTSIGIRRAMTSDRVMYNLGDMPK